MASQFTIADVRICIKALTKVNVRSSDALDFIYRDEDGEPVMGPDGLEGWFNSYSDAKAFEHIDPSVVRKFIDIYFLCHKLTNARYSYMEESEFTAYTMLMNI